MDTSRADFHYNQIKHSNRMELENLEKYKKINVFLRKSDWLFISPIFFQGFELNYFLELSLRSEDTKAKILKVIENKFYNLNHTASFTDGYCSRCTYFNPFLKSVEHGIVLAFQKDYEGAIKTLIPIIEGVLRKYLLTERPDVGAHISFDKLKGSFRHLKHDLIVLNQENILNYHDDNKIRISFNDEQTKDLLRFHEVYYETWFSFITDFIEHSFYLNTQTKNITNEVNRHSILHELGNDFSYDFENFIKVFFVIQFLTWVFLQKERKSTLNEVDTWVFLDKLISYRNIIRISEHLAYEKHILYNAKRGYNKNLLRQRFKPAIDLPLGYKNWIIIALFRWFDKQLWKRGFPSFIRR